MRKTHFDPVPKTEPRVNNIVSSNKIDFKRVKLILKLIIPFIYFKKIYK